MRREPVAEALGVFGGDGRADRHGEWVACRAGRGVDDAIRAEQHVVDLRRIDDDDDQHVAARGERRRRIAGVEAERDGRRDGSRVDVAHCQSVAAPMQVARDRQPHHADADDADPRCGADRVNVWTSCRQ